MNTKVKNPDGRPTVKFNQEFLDKVYEYYDLTKTYKATSKFINYYHRELLPYNRDITIYLVKQIIKRRNL